MKVTFIAPGIGKRKGEKYLKSMGTLESLPISTLKALTPEDVETKYFDDRTHLIDYDIQTDLVAITVDTFTALRAYTISRQFRKRGVPVVMGGYHPTLLPEEVEEYADAVAIGNAETIWPTILRDAKAKKLKKRYYGTFGFPENIIPDRSVYENKKYPFIGLVETGRGCSFNCDFCAITKYYNGKYYPRDIDTVVRDIKSTGKKNFFFIDDNFVANPDYAIALCKAVEPLKIKWSSQGSLTMAKNTELLRWMKKSGCVSFLIGIESLEKGNLNLMNKAWNAELGNSDAMVERINDEGLSIYASFVFGYDHDTPEMFDKAVAFSIKHGFIYTAFNNVMPLPGTPFYNKLKAEGRLLTEKWWLDPTQKFGYLPFHPKNITHDEVTQLCAKARREFMCGSSIFKRWIKLLKRNQNPMESVLYFFSNVVLRDEVNKRMEIPFGINLDELPK